MLTWSDNYLIGVALINSQHKELFDYANKLLISMRDGKAKSEIINTFKFLNDYVIKHFADEEKLQVKFNYPKYSFHKSEHEKFKNELDGLNKIFQTTGVSSIFVINTQQKLTAWLRNHIYEIDKDFGVFYNQLKTK